MIAVPTLLDVLVIHELLLAEFGGMRGVTEQGFGKLESAVATPHHSMFGAELYPDLPSKAAALFYGLVRAHGFSDGNKRVALVALLELLARSGWQLHADDEAIYQFVMAAADDLPRADAERWIAASLQPLP